MSLPLWLCEAVATFSPDTENWYSFAFDRKEKRIETRAVRTRSNQCSVS